MQKLMTKEIEAKVPQLYATDGQGKDAIAYAHYFSPYSGWDWYMTEFDPATQEAFGLVKGFATEIGYFSIAEFEDANRESYVPIVERDTGWTPRPLKEV